MGAGWTKRRKEVGFLLLCPLPTRSSGREAFHPNTSGLEVSVTKLESG